MISCFICLKPVIMKSIVLAVSIVLGLGMASNESTTESKQMKFYDFKVADISGETFDFASLEGKRVMIVNTASKCGYTPQYEELQKLYEAYGGDNFEIIGFPCNDFGGQEPGSEADIATFCQKNYGVTFPMMSKVGIKGLSQATREK